MLTRFDRETIDELMTAYSDSLKRELGNNLLAVILYGSCARNDHEIGSDIDVFVLVQHLNEDVMHLIHSLSDKIDWNYDTLISNTIRSADMFNKYKTDTLYSRIMQEGRVFYGAA